MVDTQTKTPFYVVSMGKFSALFLGTLGLYQFYWFYKNWQLLGAHQQRNTLPILRAFLHLFFITFLCKELAEEEKRQDQHYRWNPQTTALGFIVLELVWLAISYAVDKQSLGVGWLLLFFPLLFGHFLYLYKFQLVANRVCNDPFGKANSKFTAANHAWMVIGFIMWLNQIVILYLLISGKITLDTIQSGIL